jgi:branched-chain amino acid aminotransferase
MYTLTETEWIWRDGTFVRWADATIHVMSHSVQYGSSVFEGIRCYETPAGPAIFRLQDHLVRLFGSCRIYRMEMRFTPQEIADACCALVRRNGMAACYLRPMVLRGYGAASMVPFASPVEVFLPCWPWGAYLGEGALENGVDAGVSSWNRVAPNTIPTMAKMAGNYLSGMLVKMQALADGYAEGIALGPDGMISEGSGQNVFLVRGGTIFTPPVDGTLLPGVTRDTVLTLARDLELPVKEIEIPREALYLADEVFFSGTAAEITPVRSVDRITVGAGKPGPVTRALQQRFTQTVTGAIPDTHGWLTSVGA